MKQLRVSVHALIVLSRKMASIREAAEGLGVATQKYRAPEGKITPEAGGNRCHNIVQMRPAQFQVPEAALQLLIPVPSYD